MRYFPTSLLGLIADASNIRIGENPDYTTADFYAVYPQFEEQVPDNVVQIFVNLAQQNINKARWHGSWDIAMAFFIAHFLTLYVKTCGTTDDPITNLASGNFRGVQSSKSVDGVSVSYDVSSVLSDLTGWGGYKMTEYGIQLLTLSRLYRLGGVYIH